MPEGKGAMSKIQKHFQSFVLSAAFVFSEICTAYSYTIINNNEYLECLTRTGPKRLHVLYKYILSKFNAYNMNAHTCFTQTRTRTHACTHIHTHQGNETEEKVFKKRKVLKEDLKELTEVEWRTETGTITPFPPHTPHPYI